MAATVSPASAFDALREGLAHARALSRSGDAAAALRRLEELAASHPTSGVLWQERAACLAATGDRVGAAAAYRRAVEFNDALPDAWRALAGFARTSGRAADAERAAAALAKLQALPPELVEGSSRLSEGDLDGAESIIRGYLTRHGAHLDGMRLLAQICSDRKNFDDAELLLEAILDRNPDYHEARYELGMIFKQRRRFYPALLQAERLLALFPQERKLRLLYAGACDGLGRFEEALAVYRQLLAETPEDRELEFAIGLALRNQGKTEESVGVFRRLMRLEDSVGSAYAALADMKTFRFSDEDLAAMRRIAADPQATPQHIAVCFALGKALEDRGDYEESFHCYARGNALRRAEARYHPEAVEHSLGIREALFTPEFFAARRGVGCPRPDPIFIVGMPRAGSTLLEQILASHSQVDGTLELPEIPRLVKQFRPRRPEERDRYAEVLTDLRPEEWRRLGEIYLEETQVYREKAPFFIDKMPGNFLDVGFIHLILPNAKIIDARRDAMACCFSNFKQLFGNGQEFSYGLRDVGHYYRHYVRLMAHWDRVLPGKVLRVWHADTVNDFEGTVRRLLDFCGLSFEPACLEFHKTERAVRTVSSEQVRRPIYREGLDQWRHFEPWLGPLQEALGSLAGADPRPTER